MISKFEISSLKDYLETNDESELKIARGLLEDVILLFEEIQQYRSIGTVEECREAMERRKPKKVRISHIGVVRDRGKAHCPNCGLDIHGKGMIGACFRCGQAISWERDNP